MKNIKIFENFNEEESNDDKILFDMFIDYGDMSPSDFKDNYEEDEELYTDEVLAQLKDLWSRTKLEAMFDGDDMFPSIAKLDKMTYENVYVFTVDHGTPQVYIVSSADADLLDKIDTPDEM